MESEMEMDWQAGASSARGRGRGSREGDAKERACARGVGVGGGGGGSRAVGLDDASLSLSVAALSEKGGGLGWVDGWMGVARDWRPSGTRARSHVPLSTRSVWLVVVVVVCVRACGEAATGSVLLRYAGRDAFCCRKQKMAARSR